MRYMIEAFDERVKDWILSVAAGTEVSLAAPKSQESGSGVGAYLLDVTKAPPSNTGRRPAPLHLTLRYLVTTWSDNPEDAHQLLVRLMFAAMESADYQIEADPPPVSVWRALGVSPRPAFFLRVPLVYERPSIPAKLVRQPLKIQASPLVSLHGLVLGPDKTPLTDCRVEIPALHLSTSTDYKGRFCFPGVPGEGASRLLVKAKGRELPVMCDGNYPDSAAPLVINFSPMEA
jgi:hypothetical protein